jgi:hypothetical protein
MHEGNKIGLSIIGEPEGKMQLSHIVIEKQTKISLLRHLGSLALIKTYKENDVKMQLCSKLSKIEPCDASQD